MSSSVSHAFGEHVLLLQRPQRRRLHQPPRGLEARDHGFQIGRIAEEIRIDQRRGKRIGAVERNAAAALRPQQADVAGKAGAAVALAAVIVGHRHAEMQLDVGNVEVGPGFQEAAAFGEIRGHRPAAFAPVLADGPQQPRQRLQRDAVEVRIVRHVAEHEIRMVLQVLPDAGQMMHAGDAVLAKCGAVADARQHQQLRRLERAGGDDHLAPGADLLQLLALPVLDADRALALEQDAGGMSVGLDAQIGAACHMRDGYRRAPRSSARRSVCVTW